MRSITRQLMRNITTSWGALIVGVALTFFFTPYLVRMLGKEQYGIWTLAFSIISYLGLADLGMKQSLVRYISKHYATQDWEELRSTFRAAVRLYAVSALLILVIALLFAFGLLRLFRIAPEHFRLAQAAVLILGIDQALEYLFLPYISLGAVHRFDVTITWRVIASVGQTLGILVLLEAGQSLLAMALMVAAWGLVRRLGVNYFRRKRYPEMRYTRGPHSPAKMRLLLSYGWISFLIVATWMVIYRADHLVIGSFLSMEAVAVYAIAGTIILQLRSLVNSVAVMIVPTVSHFEAERNLPRIMDLYAASTRYLYYASGFLLSGVLLFGGPFILLWVGEDFRPAIRVLHTLMIPAAVYFPQMVANAVLFGISRHRVALKVLASEAVCNLALSLVLVRPLGIWGVALGTAVPQLVIYTVAYPVAFFRVMNSRVRPFYAQAARSLLLAGLFTAPAGLLLRRTIAPADWLTLFLDCGLMSLAAGVGFVAFVLRADDRERGLARLRGLITRPRTVVKELEA